MNKIKDLYTEYPFRSAKKFIPITIEHGFTMKEANKFLSTIPRDIKFTNQSNLILPIYGKHMGCYQMDTLVQSKTAKPMDKKNAHSTIQSLKSFISEANDIQSLTTDQDVTDFLLQHHIDHRTTFSNDHNRLGIINRAIKTLHDSNGTT